MKINLLIILISASFSFSQPREEWIRYFPPPGGDSIGTLYDVYQTAEGGFAMTGMASSEDGRLIWLLLADSEGQTIQESLVPPDLNGAQCSGYSIVQDDAGGFVIGGEIRTENIRRSFAAVRVEENGEFIWWREWGFGRCQAVIELKSGEFLACGSAGTNDGVVAKVVVFTRDGRTIWNRNYNQFDQFFAVRQCEVGAILVGHQGVLTVVCRIEEDGDLIDYYNHGNGLLRSIISCEGGFAVSGGTRGNYIAMRLDQEGDLVWRSEFNITNGSTGIARMPENGFIICGGAGNGHHAIRMDRSGNLMWQRDYNFNGNGASPGWQSVISDQDGYAFAIGYINNQGAVLIKLQPDISSPQIVSRIPESSEMTVLSGDSIEYSVQAFDIQEDSLWYVWSRNGQEIIRGNPVVIYFDSTGIDTINCTVFDTTGFNQTNWYVTIVNLFIARHTPDSLDLTLRRGASQTFTLDSVAAIQDDDPIQYLWTLADLTNQQSNEIGEDSSVTVHFVRSGNYAVTGEAYRNDASDAVTWRVAVRGAVLDFVPPQLDLTIRTDTTIHFEVFAFNPGSDSLSYAWYYGEDLIGLDSAAEVIFGPEEGIYTISAVVMDGAEGDTVVWRVRTVAPARIEDCRLKIADWGIKEVWPNPFNSLITIRYQSAESVQSADRLTIHDISGREVARLTGDPPFNSPPASKGGKEGNSASKGGKESGIKQGGNSVTQSLSHSVTTTWDASTMPAGVYLIRLQSGGNVAVKKVVLMR
jgi:hypothetical protein